MFNASTFRWWRGGETAAKLAAGLGPLCERCGHLAYMHRDQVDQLVRCYEPRCRCRRFESGLRPLVEPAQR